VQSEIFSQQRAEFRGDLAGELREFQRRNEHRRPLREPLSGKILRNYVYKPLLHCHVV
jgi:hypothetical protein